MGTTIDHLSADHRYRVMQAFTDLNGVAIAEGATGVIKAMGFDVGKMQISIDWQGEADEVQHLVFALRATDGPRNGRMKDYFELIEEDLSARSPLPPPKPVEPEPPPSQPETAFDAYRGQQPQGEICLDDLTVACDCGKAFHRSLLPAGRLHVNACLRCGAVTVTRSIGDDGRFTGNAWTAYWVVPTPQHIVDWLGRFPRVQIDYAGAPWRWPMSASLVRYPTLFYPADTRVRDAVELAQLEASLRAEQAPLSRAERLSAACGRIPPPPSGLSDDFSGFASVQRALTMDPDSDLSVLEDLAHLLSPACELAAARLIARPDAYAIMMDWIRSPDKDTFGAGIAMLRDARPLFDGPDDPRLAPEILALLDSLPLGKLQDVPDRVESWWRFECILVAIADLRIDTPAMLAGLAALMRKLAKKDASVVDAIRKVINELKGVDNRPEQYR